MAVLCVSLIVGPDISGYAAIPARCRGHAVEVDPDPDSQTYLEIGRMVGICEIAQATVEMQVQLRPAHAPCFISLLHARIVVLDIGRVVFTCLIFSDPILKVVFTRATFAKPGDGVVREVHEEMHMVEDGI